MNNTHITNQRMDAFITSIAKQAKELLHERADDMLASWQENIEESQNNDDKKFPPLKVSIGATVDIESAKIDVEIKFSSTFKSKSSVSLPDPDQPELFGIMNGEIITEGGES